MKKILMLANKSIALTLALSLLYSQVLWAADVRQMLLDAKAAFELEDTRRGDGGITGEELEAAQESQQSEVDQQQALQDLQGMNFSLTTQNGDLLEYVGDQLSRVTRPDGTTLKNIGLDDAGNIVRADLRLADGSIQVYENGAVLAYSRPDGTDIFYTGGRVDKVVSPDGMETAYFYQTDASGAVTAITLDNTSFTSLYDAQGRLLRSVSKADGRETHFTNGLLSRIVELGGSETYFTSVSYGNDFKVVYAEEPEDPAFEYLLYGADGALKEARLTDGSRLFFDEYGRLREALDGYGNATEFSFEESALANITQSRISQGGIESIYDAGGVLSAVKFEGMTIHYKKDAPEIDFIEREDGTQLRALGFSESGDLEDAIIVLPDGEVRSYLEGDLASLTRADGTELFYADGRPIELTTAADLRYHFDYQPDKIEATLDPSIVPDALSATKLIYDSNFNLKQAIRQNREILNYLDNELFRIDLPSGESQVFEYVKDSDGKVLSYSVTQGLTQTFYDANDQPVRALIHPAEQGGPELEVIYRYGKIRQIHKNGVLTFKYTYSFEGGEEITQIEDLEEKALKTYKNSLLLKSLDIDTQVLSVYTYDPQGKVSAVSVLRFGRVLHSYTYAYEGEDTIVTDEEGVIRTYGADKKLRYLERDRMKYAYTYTPGLDGEEITGETLIEKKLFDGSIVFYELGLPARVERPDGTVLSDIEKDASGKFLRAAITLPSGLKKVFNEETILEEIHPDGTHFYFEDGKIARVVRPDGRELAYSYERDAQGNIVNVWVDTGGALLEYAMDGSLLGLKLDVPVAFDGLKDFSDESGLSRSLTAYGDVQMDTQNFKMGNAAGLFDGAGDEIRSPDSTDWALGTGAWSMEAWINIDPSSTAESHILSNWNGSDGAQWMLGLKADRKLFFSSGNAFNLIGTIVIPAGEWHHVKAARSGSTITLYVDGVSVGSTSTTLNLSSNRELVIGNESYGGKRLPFKGSIDDVKIVKAGQTKFSLSFDGKDNSYFNFTTLKNALGAATGYEFQGAGGKFSFGLSGNLESVTTQNGVFASFQISDNKIQSILEPAIQFFLQNGNVTGLTLDSGFTIGDLAYSAEKSLEADGLADIARWSIATPAGQANSTSHGSLRYVDGGEVIQSDLVDMNGDGLLDRVYREMVSGNWQPYWMVQLNTGSGFAPSIRWDIWTVPGGANDGRHGSIINNNGGVIQGTLVDMNGDGLPDRVYHGQAGNAWQPYWMVQINNGAGFNAAQQWNIWTIPGNANDANHGAVKNIQSNAVHGDLIDMNGDGRPDRVYRGYANGAWQPYWMVQINNGAGFDAAQQWNIWTIPGSPNAWDHGALEYRNNGVVYGSLIDMNGDGRPDRVYHNYENNSWQPSWMVQINTGSGFAAAQKWEVLSVNGNNETYNYIGAGLKREESGATYVDLVDINGDGLPDRVNHGYANGTWQPYWEVQFNTGTGLGPVQKWNLVSTAGNNDQFNYWGGAIRNTTSGETYADLIDVNGDDLPDRVNHTYANGSYLPYWDVQLNTGTGLGPVTRWFVDATYGNNNDYSSSGAALRIGAGSTLQSDFIDLDGDGVVDRVNHLWENGDFKPFFEFQSNQAADFDIAYDSTLTVSQKKVIQPLLRRYLTQYDKPVRAAESLGGILSGLVTLPFMETIQNLSVTVALGGGLAAEYFLGELKNVLRDGAAERSFVYQEVDGKTHAFTSGPNFKLEYDETGKLYAVYLPGGSTEAKYLVREKYDSSRNFTGYALTGEGGEFLFAPGEFLTIYPAQISKNRSGQITSTYHPAPLPGVDPAYYGTGSDGDAVLSVNTTLTRDMHYRNLTVNTGVTLNPNGYKIYVNGELINKGVITAKGGDGGHATHAYSTKTWDRQKEAYVTRWYAGTPGSAGVSAYSIARSLGTSAAGKAGRAGHTWGQGPGQGYSGDSVVESFGGAGGAGGRGGGRADDQDSASGGQAGAAAEKSLGLTPSLFKDANLAAIRGGASGGSGAGGGGPNGSSDGMGGSGGGSGAGGGILFIAARSIHNASGTITAAGGNGGNGGNGGGIKAGSGGGGAGGGGGAVILAYDSITDGTINVAGGLGGVRGVPAGGTNGGHGTNGADGTIFRYTIDESAPIFVSMEMPNKADRYALSALHPQIKEWSARSFEAILDPQTIVGQEYSSDGILETQTKADQTVTLFNDVNRPEKVLDLQGNVLIEYSYDAEGHPSRVFLKNARKVLPDEVLKAETSIEEQRADALYELAAQKKLAVQSIRDQAMPQRIALKGQLNNLQNQYNNVSSIDVSGKKAKNQRGDVLNQIGHTMDDVRRALGNLAKAEADAYAALDSQVRALSDDILADTAAALTELSNQEAALKREILLQEVSPVVYDYYRRILGRDPSSSEYQFWVNKLNYDSTETADPVFTTEGVLFTQALNVHIQALPELAERTAYVNSIKAKVVQKINSYLLMSDVEKESFASSLGLSQNDLIPLSSVDAQKILGWLETRSLHFGQSAFLSLESLLDQKGISYAREDIAERAILIDILSGVISPLDDGDLVISVFALNKVASLYGVGLSGANLSWEDLQEIFRNDPSARVIAHINRNHYVIITAISDTTVTYIDPGIGKDKENESLTVTKEGFQKAWKGNVAGDSVILSAAEQREGSQMQLLSAQATKDIRGAFWGSLLNLIGSVLNIIMPGLGVPFQIAAFVVSLIEGDWMTAISSVVNVAFTNFDVGGLFKGAFQGVSDALGGVGTFFGNIFSSVKGFFSSISDFFQGIAAPIFGSKIASDLVNTAIGIGVNYGVSMGLESIGVDPQISGYLGSLASGALIGGMRGDTIQHVGDHSVFITQAQYIQSSVLQTVLLNDIGRFGLELGIDPSLTNIIGLSLGAIQGTVIQHPGTTFEAAFNSIKPQFFSSLAFYGVEKLGASLGVDPRFTGILSLPLSSALNAQLSGGNIVNVVNDGILRGVTNLVIDYTGETLNLNPLLTGVSASVLGGAISGLFGIQQVDPYDPNQLVKPSNMFEGISNAFLRGLSTTLTLGGGPGSDSWSQLTYLQRVSDFSSIVNEMGLIEAIDSYASGMFAQSAIEQMIQISGSVGSYIQDQLLAGNYVTKFEDGYEYKYILLPDELNDTDTFDPYSDELDDSYIKLDDAQGHEGVYGFGGKGWVSEGLYDLLSTGSIALNEGYSNAIYEGSSYVQKWYAGEVGYTNIYGQDNGFLGTFYSDPNSLNLMIAGEDQLIDGQFFDVSGSTMTIQGGEIVSYNRTMTQEGIGSFVSDAVAGLGFVNSTLQSMQLSAGQGALDTLLNEDYKNVSGISAASLANYIGENSRDYLSAHYQLQSQDFEQYASLFGEVGQRVSDLYDGYLAAQEFVANTAIEGVLDAAYLGAEIPYILNELGGAIQAFKAGDTDLGSRYVGSITTRLYREGNRAVSILSLGMYALNQSTNARLISKLNSNLSQLRQPSIFKYTDDMIVTTPDLSDEIASTFRGFKYTPVKLKEDVIVYRVGNSKTALGEFYTADIPLSQLQARIDRALPFQWPGSDALTVYDTVYKVKLPKDAVMYVGDASSYNGIFVGGKQQLFIKEPWKLEGTEVLESWALKGSNS